MQLKLFEESSSYLSKLKLTSQVAPVLSSLYSKYTNIDVK